MSYLLLGVPLFALFWNLYWLVVRPERKRRRAAAALEPRLPEEFVPRSAALVPPEPKAPRDVSRTYPRPARSRSKLNRICPVCGMEDPGNLDGKVLGWPAHRSCAEWLGDWRPARQVPDVAKLRGALDDCASSHKVIVLPPGGTVVNVKGSPGVQVNVGNHGLAMLASGMVSVDEMRQRVTSAFAVPSAMLGATWSAAGDRQPFQAVGDGLYHPLSAMASGNHRPLSTMEQRQKPPGVPALFCDCPCGRKYIGTAGWLNQELALHRGSGECEAYR